MSQLITHSSLVHDLQRLGVEEGMHLLVHCAFGQLGQWVCGDALALIEALQATLGETGTLMMPTHTAQVSEPSLWINPPVPEAWWPIIREQMPLFDTRSTPTLGMGLLAETFRTQPGVLRSDHPLVSFAARGAQAAYLLQNHSLSHSMGPESPLGRFYALGGQVLLIGVGYDVCTSFHLAEHFMPPPLPMKREGAPLRVNGHRQWVFYDDLIYNEEPFAELGEAFEDWVKECPPADGAQRAVLFRRGLIAAAESRLFSQAVAVDFAKGWLRQHLEKKG